MGIPPSRRLGPFKVAILLGGQSSERSISLASGRAVADALRSRGHEVVEVDPAEEDLHRSRLVECEATFLALHGQFGEDGQVQEILERIGIPYTGSDAAASKLAFSKSATKERFLHAGVPTPAYVLIHKSDEIEMIQRHAQALSYPLVVKPDRQGSSLGVCLVEQPAALPEALADCFRFDSFGLLEQAIMGSEWTVGMLDEWPLPLIQISTSHALFDFQAKYEDESTRYHFDFELAEPETRSIESVACRACRALGTRGIARVDLRLDSRQQPWVLEVNTVPGFTDHSLVPKAANRMGMNLGELCELAISRCLKSR